MPPDPAPHAPARKGTYNDATFASWTSRRGAKSATLAGIVRIAADGTRRRFHGRGHRPLGGALGRIRTYAPASGGRCSIP